MEYTDAVAYAEELGKFGSHLGLERIQGLLALMGHPEKSIRTIHITGTNGKGSATAFLASILKAAGKKTGSYISPHLVRYNERICIDGEEISNRDFAAAAEVTRRALDAWMQNGGQQPTQFEFITAMAFWYFAQKKVDYAVIEVGMGGLWDSTNVIVPQVSVITNVSLEHTRVLGRTIGEIAVQKAGIIKKKVPVVTCAEGEALAVIQKTAAKLNAPLFVMNRDFAVESLESSMEQQIFRYQSSGKSLTVTIHLPGPHQLLNGAAALKAVEILQKEDPYITDQAILRGMADARWPGRLELIHRHPDIILDGAHNPAGVTVLRKALDLYYPDAHRIFVLGMMADKDVQDVSNILFRDQDSIYTVLAHEGERAEKPEKLAQRLHRRAVPVESLPEAYRRAVREADKDSVVIVCGSLYLVGTFKELGLG